MFRLFLILGIFFISSFANAQSTTVFGPQVYFSSSSVRQVNTTRTQDQLQQSYRLLVKNADGGLHSQRNCSGLNWFQKLLCQVENGAQQLYVNTLRAESVTITLNNQQVVSSANFNRNTAQVELPIAMELNNQLHIQVSGTAVSYIEIRILATGSETPVDQTAPVLTHNTSGMQYTAGLPSILNLSITSNESLQSLEVDNQVITGDGMVYTFTKSITQLDGNQIQVKAVDMAGNITELTYNLQVTLDNVTPLITLGSFSSYTNANSFLLPVTVQDDSPTITRIFINSSEVASVNQNQFSYLIELPTDGIYQIQISSTDAANNNTVESFEVVRTSAPLSLQIQTPVNNVTYESTTLLVKFNTNHPLSSALVNGVSASILPDGKSVEYLWTSPFDGPFVLQVKVTDIFENELTQNVSATIQLGGSALWGYTECPVE